MYHRGLRYQFARFKSSSNGAQRDPKPVHESPNPVKLAPKVITDQFKTLRPNYTAPKYPIVLCHGFSGFDSLNLLPYNQGTSKLNVGIMHWDYWFGIKEALENIGAQVMIAKVPPFSRINDRANRLHEFISKKCETIPRDKYQKDGEGLKINLIAHSMGGLDSRYLISQIPNKPYQVASLTTVSTPHHGSECADFVEELIGSSKIGSKVCPQAIFELTTHYMKEFNKQVPNDPNVEYFSYGARFKPRWYSAFLLSWNIIKSRLMKNNQNKDKISIDNDGMVSVESAKWGEYLGTLDEVDHLDLINWTNRVRTALDKSLFQKEPNFNAIALYLDIADNLKKRGL